MIAAAKQPTQVAMDLRDARFRPLVNANAAMAMLDVDALEVDNLIDLGMLAGFDISTAQNRKELRVLTRSIEHHKTTIGSRAFITIESGTWEKIFKLLLPHEKPVMSGVELQRSMNCDSGHVLNLIGAKLLIVAKGTDWQRGPGGSPSVLVASYEKFMKGRML
jgi:hypothetical protein